MQLSSFFWGYSITPLFVRAVSVVFPSAQIHPNWLGELGQIQDTIAEKKSGRREIEKSRKDETHPVDGLTVELHSLWSAVENVSTAIRDSELSIREQQGLKEQVITARSSLPEKFSGHFLLADAPM